MNVIQRVAIVGGVHGNELTGACLVKKFQQMPVLVQRPSFETLLLLGNPRALQVRQRYVEADLNRCFSQAILNSPTADSYEASQAKSLHQMLGGKGSVGDQPADFILDLHSSTANMGFTLILVNEHPHNLKLAAYLTALNARVRIYRWTSPGKENAFLNSLCEFGFALEVGPIAQGLLDAELFQATETVIYAILDYLAALNQGTPPQCSDRVTVYQHLATMDYPKDEQGDLQAMIHPQLQGRDYEPLFPGDPMFMTFEGQTIPYAGDTTVHPIFINEAAYYEKGIAMCLTQKRSIAV
ncbi:MAG: aspartoacylase [Leptolyngbya sp. SIO1E4]|nr:aspartoacylase [Leptolyngbya sp. SIO1E4]